MNTPQLLELLNDLLRGADRHAGEPVEIVPVLMDELVADLPLIDAVLRHHGAPLLVAADSIDGVERCEIGVAGLFTAIHLPAPPDRQVVLETLPGDRVAARLDSGGGTAASLNPGAVNFLGALTALMSPELLDQALGVVAYVETSMDVDYRTALWEFLLDTLPSAGTRLPARLIVLIGNETVDFDHHCRRGPSLRYAMQGPNLLERRSWDNSRAAIARLAEPSDDPLVLFLGAGFAASSGLPLGNELRDEALRRHVVDREGLPFDLLARRFHGMVETDGRLLPDEIDMPVDQFVARLTLERVLREEIHGGEHRESKTLADFRTRQAAVQSKPGLAVRWLQRILAAPRRLVIITVNFDELLEFGHEDQVRVFASDESFDDAPSYLDTYLDDGGLVPLLKLHGTAGDLPTIVANVDQTAVGLSPPRSAALHALLRDGDYVPWVYVGYSMRDPDVLQVIQQPAFTEAFHEQWVGPFPDPHVAEFVAGHRAPLWANARVRSTLHERSITERADVFMEQLGEDMGLSL